MNEERGGKTYSANKRSKTCRIASDFAGSLSTFRQTFLNMLFLDTFTIEGQPRCSCGQLAMGNNPYFGVSISQSGAEAGRKHK